LAAYRTVDLPRLPAAPIAGRRREMRPRGVVTKTLSQAGHFRLENAHDSTLGNGQLAVTETLFWVTGPCEFRRVLGFVAKQVTM